MIREVGDADMPEWKALRERSVAEHPEAFLVSLEEEKAITLERAIERRAEGARRGGFILGAWLGSELVGTVGLFREDREKAVHKAIIWGMYVAPEARERGLGRALIEGALARARAIEGVSIVQLSVITSNRSAIQLYRSVGFVGWGVERAALCVDGVILDETHMQLDL